MSGNISVQTHTDIKCTFFFKKKKYIFQPHLPFNISLLVCSINHEWKRITTSYNSIFENKTVDGGKLWDEKWYGWKMGGKFL
jgi:hypothetical protein